jgi:hypothetical protein
VARAFTTVPGARSREDFIDGLRCGMCVPAGRSGGYAPLTSEVARVFASGYAESGRQLVRGELAPVRLAASLALFPLLPCLPLVTLAIYARERAFGRRLFHAFQAGFGWPESAAGRAPLAPPRLEEAA